MIDLESALIGTLIGFPLGAITVVCMLAYYVKKNQKRFDRWKRGGCKA